MFVHQVPAADHLPGNPHHHGLRRNVLDHDRVGSDAAVTANGDVAQDLCARSDDHAALQGGVSFDLLESGAAKGNPMIQRHLITDHCRLTDYDAHAVVDEHPPTQAGSRMDFNAGEKAGYLRIGTGEPLQPLFPQPMLHAMRPNGVYTWITGDDHEGIHRGWVALKGGPHIFRHQAENIGVPFCWYAVAGHAFTCFHFAPS